jgi:hypothetical protein
MPRIRVADVLSTAVQAARTEELAVAAGSNGLVSRREQRLLAPDLRDAVDAARAQRPGRAVRIDDALAAFSAQLATAVAAVNQAAGPGQPLLSRAEVKNLVQREPLAGARVQRALDLLVGPPLPAPIRLDGAAVDAELKALLPSFTFDGLLGSEGGEPVSSVYVAPGLPVPPSGEELARAFGHDPATDVGAVERFRALDPALLAEFLGQQQAPAADVARVGGLLRGLQHLRVLVVGTDGGPGVDANHPTYLVGVARDGSVVGLKTGVIWT